MYPDYFGIRDKSTGKLITRNNKPVTWKRVYAAREFKIALDSIEADRFIVEPITVNGRESVEYYLNSSRVYSKSPLIFTCVSYNNDKYLPIDISDNPSIDNLVYRALGFSRNCSSTRLLKPLEECLLKDSTTLIYNSYTKETSAGRNRSSLDLWRHLKFYLPEITIYDVMHSLYNLMQDKPIHSQYCYTVQRRVFNCRESGYTAPINYGIQSKDEYGLLFSEWKNI
jgi:hypothetical protein